MLTGSDLLAKFKEVEGLSDSEQCRACGYFSTKKNGETRLNYTAYYKALLEAKGMKMGGNSVVGKGGRKLSYVATVQGNGNLLIGKAYTALLELKPGDKYKIKFIKKQIRLTPNEDS